MKDNAIVIALLLLVISNENFSISLSNLYINWISYLQKSLAPLDDGLKLVRFFRIPAIH